MPGDRSRILNESPWPDNLNSGESDRSGILASGSSRQEINGERLPHGPEEVVTVGARAQSGRAPLGQMSRPIWKAGPFEEAEGAHERGKRGPLSYCTCEAEDQHPEHQLWQQQQLD